MIRLLALVLLVVTILALVPALSADAKDVYVRGHFRRDGTYVAPHHRTSPDGNPYNNYGTYPNVNPYTGEQGTRHRDRQPEGTWQPMRPSRPTCVQYGTQILCY